jgi:hypothetical protein
MLFGEKSHAELGPSLGIRSASAAACPIDQTYACGERKPAGSDQQPEGNCCPAGQKGRGSRISSTPKTGNDTPLVIIVGIVVPLGVHGVDCLHVRTHLVDGSQNRQMAVGKWPLLLFPQQIYTFSLYDRTSNSFMYRLGLISVPALFLFFLSVSVLVTIAFAAARDLI